MNVAGPSTVQQQHSLTSPPDHAQSHSDPISHNIDSNDLQLEYGPHPLQGIDSESRPGNPVVVKLESADQHDVGGHDTSSDSLGSQDMVGDDMHDWIPDGEHEMKRVKVYELIGSRWVDQGTAFCFGQFQEETNEALLIARSEANYQDIILSTAIRSNDVYQRQQDTLIVWTEPDGVDYALSFQDPEGCAEVWNFILEVQQHMNGGDDQLRTSSPMLGTTDPSSVTTATIIRSGHLPAPQLGIITEIEKAIKALARTQNVKERICEYIMQEEYVKSLVDVLHQAEDLESLENLHALSNLMQTILLLNDHGMYEHILDDDIFMGVVGMLEYDPDFPTHKANYREFLTSTTRFVQPIMINDEGIVRKVHHTYRLQFLKDVVLARALDDSTFNVLSSCIIFNQIDIISHVQQDEPFLKEVVALFTDEGPAKPNGTAIDHNPKPNGTTSLSPEELTHRISVVLLVHQLCVMAKNVQLPARMALFRTLVDRGILHVVQWAITLPETDEQTRATVTAGGEVLGMVLDHDLIGVRGHIVQQLGVAQENGGKTGKEKNTLLAVLCRILSLSKDMGVQSQVGDAVKVLTEMPMSELESVVNLKTLGRTKDEPMQEKFLEHLYKNCLDILFKPIMDLPEFKNLHVPVLALTREKTNLFLYLCELLSTFVLQHTFRSHFFILSSNISTRIATLLSVRDKHLRHAAFRFFRTSVKLNNTNILKHLVGKDVFKPILALTLRESRRDNLVSASCQEFFETLRRDNVKELINHCMTKYETEIRTMANTPLGGPRFTSFIRRWEMNNEPPPTASSSTVDTSFPHGRRNPARGTDVEEDSYFNGDDDDEVDTEDEFVPSISASSRGSSVPTSPAVSNTLRKRRLAVGTIPKGFRPNSPGMSPMRTPTPLLGSLMDYDDGDEDDSFVNGAKTAEGSRDYFTSDRSPRNRSKTLPTSPTATPPRRPLSSDDDDEDSLLESLVRQDPGTARPSTPIPTISPDSSPNAPPPSPKRRRDEEDDDFGLMERLSKAKKTENTTALKSQPGASELTRGRPLGTKGVGKGVTAPGQESDASSPTPQQQPITKKLKLKFGMSLGKGVGGVSPVPSEPGTKDADTG